MNENLAEQKGLIGQVYQASPEERMTDMQKQINRMRNEIEELRRHRHCPHTGKVMVELEPYDR